MLLLSGVFNIIGATQYLGLGYEPGQGKEQRKARIVDGYIYVPTSNGLYRKSVSTLNDTVWELYGFKDISVRDFVKKNDSIIAITTRMNDNMMLLSTDNGKTFIEYTSDYFKVTGVNVYLNLLEANPLNKNTIIIYCTNKGVLKSTDFGKSWNKIAITGSLNYIGFNNADTTSIYCAGASGFSSPFLWFSYDNGISWNIPNIQVQYLQSCFVMFPSSKYANLILAGFDLWIYLSRDNGKTWFKGDKTEINAVNCFAENLWNNQYYASGTSYDNKLRVYWSYDGDFWWTYNFQPINNISSAYDIHVVGNNVLLFTERGVYNLSAQSTSLSETTLDVSVVQNGTSVSFKGTEIIESVRIYDISGKMKETIRPNNNNFTIDVSSYQKGLYLFEFGNKSNVLKKKTVIS